MWQLTVVTFCCIVGIKLGSGHEIFWAAYKEFFTFKSETIQDTSLVTCLKILPVGIIACLLTSFVTAKIIAQYGVYNKMEASVDSSLVQNIKDGSLVNFILFIFCFEEGVFRLLPMIISSFFHINVVWMLIIFNVAFALVHINNFESRNPLATIPQFCSGLVISITAFKFGFVTAAILHLYFDFVLFTTDRKIKYNSITFVTAIYYGFIALFGLWLCNLILPSFSSILVWQGPIPSDFRLNYNQAIGIIMLTYGIVKCFGNLAALDNINSKTISKTNFSSLLFFAILGCAFNVVFSLLSSWLILNSLADYPLVGTLVFALIFVGFKKQQSLSESAFNAFKVPVSALSLIIYAIVGPVITIQLAVTELLITLPDLIVFMNTEER